MTHLFNRRSILAAAAAAAAATLPLGAYAQAERTTIVVPYPPGSAPDYLARLVATKVAAVLGSTIIVDNRPGANAIIGSDYVTKAKPDGTVLLLVDRMTLVVNPMLYSKLPYDPRKLQGVSDVARVSLMLTVRSDAPYKSWKEFVEYAKAKPGEIAIGTGGNGSVHHLSLELMQRATGAKFVHVPYKGISPAVQDMLGGQIAGVISGAEVIRPHMSSGKLRVLAIGADERSPLFPDVPTLRELGVTTPVLLPTTFTLFAPVGTPEAKLTPFEAALRSVLQQPEIVAQLSEQGLVPTPSTPSEIQAGLQSMAGQLGAVIRDSKIRLD